MLSACLASAAAFSRSGASSTEVVEPDPLGHRGGGGERDKRLVVAVGDAVDRAEALEAARLRPARPLGQLGPVVPGTALGRPIDTSIGASYMAGVGSCEP